MKKINLLILPMLATLVATTIDFAPNNDHLTDEIGAAPTEFSTNTTGHFVKKAKEEENIIPTSLTIHYAADDETTDYTKKRFYVWTATSSAVELEPQLDAERKGMYVTVNPQEFGNHEVFMFIIKNKGTWDGQSADTEIPYAKFPATNGKLDVWVIDGEGNSLEVYATEGETQGGKIISAKFNDWKTISVETSADVNTYQLYAFTSEYYGMTPTNQNLHYDNYKITEGQVSGTKFEIKFPTEVPASLVYLVKTTFVQSGKTKMRYVSPERLFDTPRFEKYYTYDGDDLGVTYTKEKTTIKLWAPNVGRVALRLYGTGERGGTPTWLRPENGSNLYEEYEMSYNAGGVWSCVLDGDMNGRYYTFAVSNNIGTNEVCDPYAKAAGINGIRAMILDFDTTDPEGWDELPLKWDGNGKYDITSPTELAVYEVHMRDLTMHESWNGKSKAGTYKAFMEKGTRLPGHENVTTGHDHIEEMGFNAIQLLPVFDQSNSEIDEDETNNKIDHEFNWGYNPLNYNVVEGGYSTNPYDGAVRIKEYKELIQSYANDKNTTRVIMDVVYNHVASVSSINFNKILPKYYFRVDPTTNAYHNGAGCGNEVRTEATMMRKFIVESIKWWATEYKVKGFRFDLMGLIDSETMRLVKDALYEIDPDNVCYGEGWTAAGYHGATGTKGADTGTVYHDLKATDTSKGHLAAFSDCFRNSIKGANDAKGGDFYGFISQGSNDIGDKSEKVAQGMQGKNNWANGDNPAQTVNYASCHDNFTLYDQLHKTMSEGNDVQPEFNVLTDAILAVQSAVAFSHGISFFQSGEELLRTKIEYDEKLIKDYAKDISYIYGVPISHNSYQSSDLTNAFDYTRKISIKYGVNNTSVDTTKFYERYVNMIQSSKKATYKTGDTPLGANTSAWYSYNSNGNYVPGGSTIFAVWFQGADNANYWIFMSGRVGGDIPFSSKDYRNSDCIYNSLSTTEPYYGWEYHHNIGKLGMSPRQMLVLKESGK